MFFNHFNVEVYEDDLILMGMNFWTHLNGYFIFEFFRFSSSARSAFMFVCYIISQLFNRETFNKTES